MFGGRSYRYCDHILPLDKKKKTYHCNHAHNELTLSIYRTLVAASLHTNYASRSFPTLSSPYETCIDNSCSMRMGDGFMFIIQSMRRIQIPSPPTQNTRTLSPFLSAKHAIHQRSCHVISFLSLTPSIQRGGLTYPSHIPLGLVAFCGLCGRSQAGDVYETIACKRQVRRQNCART